MVLCLLCFVPAGSAVLLEVTEKGTVTALDAENGTMTILPDARCARNYSVTPSCGRVAVNESVEVNGTAPDPVVFSVFKVGDVVEVTLVGGEGGRWIAVGKLATRSTLPAPLVGEHAITCEAVHDCADLQMNITVLSEGKAVFEDVLEPGEELMYNGRNNNSSVLVTFIGREALSSAYPARPLVAGPQPISVFQVHVNPPIGFESEKVSLTAAISATTIPTSWGNLLVPLVAGILGCVTALRRH